MLKTALLILLLTVPALPQAVIASQKFIDSANRSFVEVDMLRRENAALKETVQAQDDLITALTNESRAKDVLINEKNALIAVQKQQIAAQTEQITALEERDKVRLAEIEALRALKCDKKIWLGGIYKVIRCR